MTKRKSSPQYVYCRPVKNTEGGFEEYVIFMADPAGGTTRRSGTPDDAKIFKSKRDAIRNAMRRRVHSGALTHHLELEARDAQTSPEEMMIERERQAALRSAVKRLLSEFPADDPARSVIAHVLLGTDLSDTIELSKKTGLSINQVTAAKRQIERRSLNRFHSLPTLIRRANQR